MLNDPHCGGAPGLDSETWEYLYGASGNRLAKGSITSWIRDASSNGFTLMELLMVISIILILMLMAIPTFGGIKKHANETSAIVSMQTPADY
jgi:prepilin-type N-terminal cleavage/methylation domain-containing protein